MSSAPRPRTRTVSSPSVLKRPLKRAIYRHMYLISARFVVTLMMPCVRALLHYSTNRCPELIANAITTTIYAYRLTMNKEQVTTLYLF